MVNSIKTQDKTVELQWHWFSKHMLKLIKKPFCAFGILWNYNNQISELICTDITVYHIQEQHTGMQNTWFVFNALSLLHLQIRVFMNSTCIPIIHVNRLPVLVGICSSIPLIFPRFSNVPKRIVTVLVSPVLIVNYVPLAWLCCDYHPATHRLQLERLMQPYLSS